MTAPRSPEYLEELLAGYVLGDLSPEEAEDLQQILVDCGNHSASDRPELVAEAQILQEVLAALPYTLPPVEPRPQLRQNILDALTINNSLENSLAKPNNVQVNLGDRLVGINLSSMVTSRRDGRKQSGWKTSGPWRSLIGGIVALVVVAIAIDNYRLRQQAIAMQRQINGQADLIAMLQQPNTRLVSLKGMDQAVTASGNIVVTPGESQAVLILQNLSPLPDGQAYQLWSIVNGQKIPWEQFRVDQRGTVFAKLSLPENQVVTRLAITVEVSPSPPEPTGPMVMLSDL